MESPEIIRDLKEECADGDFFEYHDMWHILSSHALLMGAYLVMFISYDSSTEGENQLLVNNKNGTTTELPKWQEPGNNV